MANTEGMSDEIINDLLSSASSCQQSFVQQRLDTPMGERPAATVIRRSNRSRVRPIRPPAPTLEEKTNSLTSAEATPPPVVGEVVERPLQTTQGSLSATASTRPKSKFVQQRKQCLTPKGFPSLNRPVGSFAKKNVTAVTSDTVESPRNHDQDRIEGDANFMLAQMSAQEIQESIQELNSAISPEKLEFLRKRGAQKVQANQNFKLTKSNDMSEGVPGAEAEAREKERLAKLMSSIRTYDDIDAVYVQEIGEKPNEGLDSKSEWEQAVALLRSTSPRQTLWAARTVCNYLERDLSNDKVYSIGSRTEAQYPYPVLLPVSLRCLLDSSASNANVKLLHTFVLRSIYALLKLRAPVDHVIDVTCTQVTTQSLYQEFFLDDAVPTPPSASLYPSVVATPVASNKDGQTVAYAMASTTTSAQQDGEAFCKDPMWTLLSRMRIIPRLAQVLSSRNGELPAEGLVAMSGILAMLCLRSPGAASAIAQHATILPTLFKETLAPPTDDSLTSHFLNAPVMMSVIQLLNSMARQSRVAASKIPHEDILLPILGMNLDDDRDLLLLQKWGLILWRKLLRYGLGFTGLSSLVSLSVRHIGEQSILAPEYCTVFASCLDCTRVIERQPAESELDSLLDSSDRMILASSRNWMRPFVMQCIQSLKRRDWSLLDSDVYTSQAAMLRLINSYLSPTSGDQCSKTGTENVSCEVQELLSDMLASQGLRYALSLIPLHSNMPASFDQVKCCAFINELLSVCNTICASHEVSHGNNKAKNLVLSWLINSVGSHKFLAASNAAWIKQCHYSMVVTLFKNFNLTKSDDLDILARAFALNLIGVLDLGDEAKAAVLFSMDSLFLMGDSVSSMFMRELCSSDARRKQLDHSFKLRRGFGITATELGPFAMESLLSNSDSFQDVYAGLLPLGNDWLWKVLSGSFDDDHPSCSFTQDVAAIIDSSLKLLLEIERGFNRTKRTFDSVPIGSKIYFLLNLFLYPESVLCQQDILRNAHLLMEECEAQVNSDLGAEFLAACLLHSQMSQKGQSGENLDPHDEQLLSAFSGTVDPTSKAMRAAHDFVVDLCNAYIEYGAQYEAFTKCLRVLLRPQMHPTLRCEAIKGLREVSHLMTLHKEEDQPNILMNAVKVVLLEGVPPEGERDSSEVLDVLADMLRQSQAGRRGFFFLFAVSLMSRSLVASILTKNGLEAMKRRLLALPIEIARVLMRTASVLLGTTQPLTRDIVAETTLSIIVGLQESTVMTNTSTIKLDEDTFEAWLDHRQDQ
jgi:hypothetical protein